MGNAVGNLMGKSCEKFCGKSCAIGWRGKSQFKKGSDWQTFNIWNRVMGNQPIRIQHGKFGLKSCRKSCGKILWEILCENLLGKSYGKILQEILQENLSGKSCRKIFWENLAGNLVGQFGGEKANLRKAVIGRNLAFGIG